MTAAVTIDNFTFVPRCRDGEGGHDGDLGEPRRHPAQHRLPTLNCTRIRWIPTSGSLPFDKPGTYNYICGLHPFMHGTIVVQN